VDIAGKEEGEPALTFRNKDGDVVETVELQNKNRRECREALISRGFQKVLPSTNPAAVDAPSTSGTEPPSPGTSNGNSKTSK